MDASLVMLLEVTTWCSNLIVLGPDRGLRKRSSVKQRYACCLCACLLLLAGAPQLAAQATQSDRDGEISRTTRESEEESSQHTRVRDLPRDLAKGTLQLFSRNNLLPLIAGVGASVAARPADVHLREYFDRPRLGRAGEVFGARLGSGSVVAAAVGSVWVVSRIRKNDAFAHFSYDLAEASALNGLLTFVLKRSINRGRPSGGNYSFPSGHTSSAFAAAAVVDQHYGWKASVISYATATFIGASRIDSRKHYLSDVVAGATVGYIAGRTVTNGGKAKHGLQWTPIISVSSQTVGVRAFWQPYHTHD